MNVVFLKSNIGKRGGLEKYTLRLAKGYADAGHEVTILTTGSCERKDLHIVSLGDFSFLELIRFDRACKKYLKEHPADIVFGMERNFCPQTHYRAGNGCHAAYLDRRRKTESWLKSISFSINPLHRLILSMEKSTYESPVLRKLFVNSHMVEREVLHYYPAVDPRKICVVHNGVEWHELQKPFEEGLLTRVPSDRYRFLFVGNEYGRKGLNQLLEALTELPKDSFHLTVVGKERKPQPFIDHAKKLGLESVVTFVGAVTDTKPYYSANDALVIPSLYDPFANVTVEALAMGLRVISSNANGGSEVITPETGATFDTDLASCLKDSLAFPKTPESAQKIRESVKHLDFSNQIGKIISQS
ncbi:MAG: glycosyltransferase family 4 protein [Verrucomicrobia bacterium]|nr:glycosyltransferase family 4 protein [Verrucomicrobiota bacterium]MBS0636040.1 glycosyltransferase family 4 protein [Verrucomicrobiota bacterium]